MDVLRAQTIDLKSGDRPLTEARQKNAALNQKEALAGALCPESFPRRLVFEMTNACNLRCRTCARNSAHFKPTSFKAAWRDFFEPALPYVEEVTLMGWGEPTVHPDFVGFLAWAEKHGLRKYFCTNGLKLNDLFGAIFDNHVDIIAVSLDGATPETNDNLRLGGDFRRIINSLKKITNEKRSRGLAWPWLNFVFTAMSSNLDEFPQLVEVAAETGLEEVKLVYFTAFDQSMAGESLYGQRNRVADVFAKAREAAEKNSVALKLPHLEGEDPAEDKAHKDCFCAWRDFFLGSDGYLRPCMSTSRKFVHIEELKDFGQAWHSPFLQDQRRLVNSAATAPGCENCYQSSFANWNRRESFIQTGQAFAPEWE